MDSSPQSSRIQGKFPQDSLKKQMNSISLMILVSIRALSLKRSKTFEINYIIFDLFNVNSEKQLLLSHNFVIPAFFDITATLIGVIYSVGDAVNSENSIVDAFLFLSGTSDALEKCFLNFLFSFWAVNSQICKSLIYFTQSVLMVSLARHWSFIYLISLQILFCLAINFSFSASWLLSFDTYFLNSLHLFLYFSVSCV